MDIQLGPQIQILVGPVASGKSTYARNAAKHGAIVVNDDAIVSAVHGGDYSLYDPSLKPLYKGTEMGIAVAAITVGRAVIVDRGVNCRKDSRQRWIALGRSLDVPVGAMVFPRSEPAVHAKRRASTDGRGYDLDYWLRVAETHDREWEIPAISEGLISIIYPGFSHIQEGFVWDACEWFEDDDHD